MKIYAVRYVTPGGEGKVCLCEQLLEVLKTVTVEGDKASSTLFLRMVAPINVPVDLSTFGLGLEEVTVDAIEIPANMMYEVQEFECARRPVSDADHRPLAS